MRSRLSPPLASLVASTLAVTGLAAQSFEDVEPKYREWVQRPSLAKRTDAREELAQTQDPRALPLLMANYSKPEEPQAPVRYLIAQMVMEAFRDAAPGEFMERWRRKHRKSQDAWLWFQSRRFSAVKDYDVIAELVQGRGDAFLKAATLEALAERITDFDSPAELPTLCMRILLEPPRKELDRALMVEAVGSILMSMKSKARRDPWKEVVAAYIEQLDIEDTPQRTKVVISRHLAQIFGVMNLGFEPHWWRSELNREPNRAKPDGKTTTVPFFSVRTLGFRFVYVIDASDSMLARVTDNEKRDLGPTTGGGKPKPKGREGEFVPDANDIDWSRVITRFDAAREYLRLSLMSLSDDHQFAVILFGDDARLLDATPKLVKASKGKIRQALAELERIKPGPPTDSRPDGVLRGKTNLHGGIAAAFRVTGSGMTRKEEYVDEKAMFGGCDTVFVLSDGAPSWDNYPEKDKRDPGDRSGDQEMGTFNEGTPILIFQGPYSDPSGSYPAPQGRRRGGLFKYLVGDTRRMNLLRRAEIHCVGIGEANHALLQAIAEIGQGQAVRVESQRR